MVLNSRREHRIRHPKSDQLSSKWQKLWINSMEYARQLREMKDYLEEVTFSIVLLL